MRETINLLKGTRLSKPTPYPPLVDKGPIRGNTEDEIDETERRIGKKLPASLRAWYRVAGAVPPYWYDYDADFSLQDLIRAQETAYELTHREAKWEITDNIIPFSQRIGDQFLFIDVNEGDPDDPSVYHCLDGDLPKHVNQAFSVFIRKSCLDWLR